MKPAKDIGCRSTKNLQTSRRPFAHHIVLKDGTRPRHLWVAVCFTLALGLLPSCCRRLMILVGIISNGREDGSGCDIWSCFHFHTWLAHNLESSNICSCSISFCTSYKFCPIVFTWFSFMHEWQTSDISTRMKTMTWEVNLCRFEAPKYWKAPKLYFSVMPKHWSSTDKSLTSYTVPQVTWGLLKYSHQGLWFFSHKICPCTCYPVH